MKIIFDNFIQDYDVLAFKHHSYSRMIYDSSAISGDIAISSDNYIKIISNPQNLLSHRFIIVNDNLKPYYQTCYVSSIKPQLGSIIMSFIVIEVGKSSIPIPELECQVLCNNFELLSISDYNYYSQYITTNTTSSWNTSFNTTSSWNTSFNTTSSWNTSFRMPQGDH